MPLQFRMYAAEAYNILRGSADLILSLFHLMAGAPIEAIRADPEKAILKLQVCVFADLYDVCQLNAVVCGLFTPFAVCRVPLTCACSCLLCTCRLCAS